MKRKQFSDDPLHVDAAQSKFDRKLEKAEDMKSRAKSLAAAVLFVIYAATAVSHAAHDLRHKIKSAVDMAIRPFSGTAQHVPAWQSASPSRVSPTYSAMVVTLASLSRVTHCSQIGSVSKTFTATLVSLHGTGYRRLSFAQDEQVLMTLQGSKFGNVNLGTHTPGGGFHCRCRIMSKTTMS